MSGNKTLLFQECIEPCENIRIFVVGNNKLHLQYELHKSPKDRYSLYSDSINDTINETIDDIIKIINSELQLDMYFIDIAIKNTDTVYLLNINPFNRNLDNIFIPEDAFN